MLININDWVILYIFTPFSTIHNMAGPATSFKKVTRLKAPLIPGTKPSLHNNQLLVSTGVPSFDNTLGLQIDFLLLDLLANITYYRPHALQVLPPACLLAACCMQCALCNFLNNRFRT